MSSTTTFGITWDYRCPFARNANEHVLVGLDAGAPWDVSFVPFSLGVHVEPGEPSVWDDPANDSGILALQVGALVRDRHPERFLAVHRALFAIRHDEGRQLNDRSAMASVLEGHDIDAGSVFAAVDDGSALQMFRNEHEAIARSHDVWGVPTFIVGDQAVFVRLMNRADPDDAQASVRAIERIVDLAGGWPELNELKHTSLPA